MRFLHCLFIFVLITPLFGARRPLYNLVDPDSNDDPTTGPPSEKPTEKTTVTTDMTTTGGASTSATKGPDMTTKDGVSASTTSSPDMTTKDKVSASTTAMSSNSPVSPVSTTPSGTSAVPTTTTTQAPTTEKLVFSEVTMNNKFVYPTDGARGLVQNILILRNQVIQLTQELQQLSADIDPTSSPLFSQMADLKNTAAVMNTTIDNLEQRLITLNETESALQQNATNIQSYLTCLASSGCITDAPTTAITTTVPAFSACPAGPPAASNEPQVYSEDNLTNVNCSYVIVGTGEVSLTIQSVTINGTAVLSITDGESGNPLESVSTTTTTPINVNGTNLIVFYKATLNSELSFKLNYELKDLCSAQDCGDNGKCKVGNGIAYCDCDPCYSLGTDQKCSKEQVCSTRDKNKCKGDTPQCVMEPDQDNINCVATCKADSGIFVDWVRKLYG